MDIETAVLIRTGEVDRRSDQWFRFQIYFRRLWHLRRICRNSIIQYRSHSFTLPYPLPASSTFFFSCPCSSSQPHVIVPSPFNHQFQKSVPATLSVSENTTSRSCLNSGVDGTITIAMKNRPCYSTIDGKDNSPIILSTLKQSHELQTMFAVSSRVLLFSRIFAMSKFERLGYQLHFRPR